MTRRVVVRPEARMELAEARTWYMSRSRVVAAAFRATVRETMVRISERPDSFAEVADGVRRALTQQFPYAIFFAEEQGLIIVLAIKHQAQDPARWPASLR